MVNWVPPGEGWGAQMPGSLFWGRGGRRPGSSRGRGGWGCPGHPGPFLRGGEGGSCYPSTEAASQGLHRCRVLGRERPGGVPGESRGAVPPHPSLGWTLPPAALYSSPPPLRVPPDPPKPPDTPSRPRSPLGRWVPLCPAPSRGAKKGRGQGRGGVEVGGAAAGTRRGFLGGVAFAGRQRGCSGEEAWLLWGKGGIGFVGKGAWL